MYESYVYVSLEDASYHIRRFHEGKPVAFRARVAGGGAEFRHAMSEARALAEDFGIPLVADWLCFECEEPIGPDYYMVQNEVWESAGVPEACQLHLACLATRIGRPLGISDFTDAPVNRLIHYGFSLRG